MKKGLFISLALLCATLSNTAVAQSNLLIKPGVLTVCAYGHAAPMIFEDSDGKTIGYEPDILRTLAEKMNVAIVFKDEKVFKGIWQKPAAKQCDVVAASLTVLAEREQQGAAFTIPHFIAHQSLLIRASDKNIFHTLKDFSGKKIAVIPGTTNEAEVKRVAPATTSLITFNYQTDMLIALANKRIDAVADDSITNEHYQKLNSELAVIDLPRTNEKLAFAVDRNNKALLAEMNKILIQIKKDGTLQKIYNQWFAGTINF